LLELGIDEREAAFGFHEVGHASVQHVPARGAGGAGDERGSQPEATQAQRGRQALLQNHASTVTPCDSHTGTAT
jgi:hypothetical protein